MHRSIHVTAPATQVQQMILLLQEHSQVISVTHIPNSAVKPAGDALQVQVLNRGADDVLKIVHQFVRGTSYTISTGEVASVSSPTAQRHIDNDIDEAIWEELETGLRHNGWITPNYLLLMALAGMISAIGFVSFMQMQIAAFIAASIIAPGLEPIAKLPLGIVMKKKEIILKGLQATGAGYGVLMLAAGLTFAILRWAGEADGALFFQNKVTDSLLGVKLMDILMSIAAAAASIIMYLSYRRHVIAGPLIALILIPAASAAAICAVLGQWEPAGMILAKTGMEVSIIVAVGILLIWVKQRSVHKRKPLR